MNCESRRYSSCESKFLQRRYPCHWYLNIALCCRCTVLKNASIEITCAWDSSKIIWYRKISFCRRITSLRQSICVRRIQNWTYSCQYAWIYFKSYWITTIGYICWPWKRTPQKQTLGRECWGCINLKYNCRSWTWATITYCYWSI